MKLSIKKIFLLPLILLFFPAFCIWISVKPIVIYYLISIAVFGLILFVKPKYLFYQLKILYKTSAFRYYLLFAIWCIFSGLLLVLLGKYKLNVYLYYIFSLLLIDYGLTYILPVFVFNNRNFNIRFFSKIFLSIYFIIFAIGILEFFGKTFGIDILIFPSDFLGNQRLISNYDTIHYLDRVRSIFAEPGWLGGFIFLNMPVLYSLTLSKYKIFDNNFINLFIKKSLIPMMWITIIIEQSAIWLIFNLILTVFYFRKYILRFIKKYFLFLLIIFLMIICLIILSFNSLSALDLGFYNRIFNFFMNLNNFDQLIKNDTSLGMRLVSYLITVKIGINNWLLGVGLGNTGYIFPTYYSPLNFPYLVELTQNYTKSFYLTDKMSYNGAIPYQFFAETGIIGLSLFYLFVYKTYKMLNKVKLFFTNLEYDFIQGLSFTVISSAIIIFYDIPEAYYYIWFLFGLTNIFIFKAREIIISKTRRSYDTKSISNNTGV